MYNDWPIYFWDNNVAFHENLSKVAVNDENGWIAHIWQNGLKNKYYNDMGDNNYIDWATTAEIYIVISSDGGITWSEPIIMNAKPDDENFEPAFDGMTPNYFYIGDKIEDLGDNWGKIHLMFLDDDSFGSYIQGHGQNSGGSMEYASLKILFEDCTGLEYSQITVSNEITQVGNNCEVNISTSQLLDEWNILSYQFDLSFDDTIIDFVGYDIEGTISEGGSVTINDLENTISVDFVSTIPLTGIGNLINLEFTSLEEGETNLTISDFFYNSTAINYLNNGTVSVIEVLYPPTNLFVNEYGFATWEAPINREFMGYYIFLDGIFIEFTTGLFYNFDNGTLIIGQTYFVEICAIYDGGASQTIGYSFTYNGTFIYDPPQNVEIDAETQTLTWEAPAGVGEWLSWDSGENHNAVGLTNGGTFFVASRWEPEDIAAYDGFEIERIKFFPCSDERVTFTLKIWTGDNAGTEVLSQDVTNYTFNEFNYITLNTSVTIDASQELWFGYQLTHDAGEYPVGADQGPPVRYYGDMFSTNGVNWSSGSGFTGYNWNLQANIISPDGNEVILSHKTKKRTTKTTANHNLNQFSIITTSPQVNRESRDLIGYNIFLNGVAIAYNITDLSYVYTNLNPGQTYTAGVSAVYNNPGESEIIEIEFTVPGTQFSPPENLVATVVDYNTVDLTWNPPGGVSAEWIGWDSGENGNAIGLTNGGTFFVASHWDPEDLVDYDGAQITNIMFFPNSDARVTFTLKIWTGPNGANEELSQEVTDFIFNEFNEIELAYTFIIDASQELWFGYEITHDAGEYPAGVDPGPAIAGYGDMISMDGSTWDPLSSFGLDYNWNLQAYVMNSNGATTMLSNYKKKTVPAAQRVSLTNNPFSVIETETSIFRDLRSLAGYKVYRDGVEIAEIEEPNILEISEEGLNTGDYEYTATAIYTNPAGESIPSNIAEATIALNPPQYLTGSINGFDLLLQWDPPYRGIDAFNIYRDYEIIGTTNGTAGFYVDPNYPTNFDCYYITAVYTGNHESEPSNIIYNLDANNILTPLITELSGNYPNPFNPKTQINFSLHQTSYVSLKIYNLKGQLVRNLVNEQLEADWHSVLWNGKDRSGKNVSSGVYLYRLTTSDYSSIKKMIMLK